MRVRFASARLERLETDPQFDGGLEPGVLKAYRKRIQLIRASVDERAFFQLRSLRFEKLKGKRKGEYSMRLNDQWRLILRFEDGEQGKIVLIEGIEDYHR